MTDCRLSRAAVVLLVLRLGQAEAEQPAVGVDLMSAEIIELGDRALRDALAKLARRLGGGDVAGGLHLFPERSRGAIALCRRRMGEHTDCGSQGADSSSQMMPPRQMRGAAQYSSAGGRKAVLAPTRS